ncbi:MAG: YigZ family protein [Spirochaetota bacterium]
MHGKSASSEGTLDRRARSLSIPAGSAALEMVVKRSRFIGYARRINSPEEVKEIIQELRSVHKGLSHIGYAFIIGGENSQTFGFSDDGEPKGTAGRPVLEILKGSGITNALIAVVRYFGGIKLGTGGLVRAYSDTAKKVLLKLPVKEMMAEAKFSVTVPYALFETVKALIESAGGIIGKDAFEADVTLAGLIPESALERLKQQVLNISHGKVIIKAF